MPVDLALAAILILTPLVRHFVEERCVGKAVKLVDIHRVNAILKASPPTQQLMELAVVGVGLGYLTLGGGFCAARRWRAARKNGKN